MLVESAFYRNIQLQGVLLVLGAIDNRACNSPAGLQSRSMTFLPIVERELRVAARHAPTDWSRVSAALLCIVISAYFLLFSSVAASQLGMTLFNRISPHDVSPHCGA